MAWWAHFADIKHTAKKNYHVQKIGGHRSKWNSAQMNNQHPWQLKNVGAVLELPANQPI